MKTTMIRLGDAIVDLYIIVVIKITLGRCRRYALGLTGIFLIKGVMSNGQNLS